MTHVVEATYENGVLKLKEPLPFRDRERVRVTVESLATERHSIMEIETVSVGELLHRMSPDDDLLDEMLEGQ